MLLELQTLAGKRLLNPATSLTVPRASVEDIGRCLFRDPDPLSCDRSQGFAVIEVKDSAPS